MEKPQRDKAPIVDHNIEKWAVFHKNDEEAEAALLKVTKKLSENHRIVSSEYKFMCKFHDGNIYQFHIVKAKLES